MKAVIIDDAESARNSLRSDLASYVPEVDVIGEADGVISGAKLLRKVNPDLVFLDIHMQDGDGFDLLEILDQKSFSVIFTTASDAHAIRAFKFSAVDYLLKPIDVDELVKAIDKCRFSASSDRMSLLRESLEESASGTLTKLALSTQDRVKIVEINEIVRCESDVNYTRFYFTRDKPLLVTKTLKEYDNLLTPNGFVRVHQSHLVNAGHIKEFVKADGGHLNLSDGSYVPVSTRRKSEVLKLLENPG